MLTALCSYHPQDYFFHKEGVNNGGNRYATVLTYLNDVEEGGETVSILHHELHLRFIAVVSALLGTTPSLAHTKLPVSLHN
jgi:hypothetical protein